MNALTYSADLSIPARHHANDQGPKGTTGHNSSNGDSCQQRLNKFGKPNYCGENISYGMASPMDIVLQLLIDDGVPSRGHRDNLFREGYNVCGVAIGPHKTYKTMCVQNIGGGYTANGTKPKPAPPQPKHQAAPKAASKSEPKSNSTAIDKEVCEISSRIRTDPKWLIPHLEKMLTRFDGNVFGKYGDPDWHGTNEGPSAV